MNPSIVLDADPSPLAALLLGHIRGGCALLAPCQRGASTPSFDRWIHPRALSRPMATEVPLPRHGYSSSHLAGPHGVAAARREPRHDQLADSRLLNT
jgi:hypothetical protein